MHLTDATGGTAGSTGRTQGLSMSSVGVGSTGSHTLGLNPSASTVNRSSVATVNLGSIGTVGGTFCSVLCSARSYSVELSGGKRRQWKHTVSWG